MIRVVESSSFCSACYQAKLGEPHVDFGAAYEGPVLRHPDGSPQTIDDLILCTGCVREAARALEIHEQPLAAVEAKLADAQRSARSWQSYAEALEGALGRRPEPVRRGRGRPERRPRSTEGA